MRINNQEIKNAEISVVSERKVQGLKGLKAIFTYEARIKKKKVGRIRNSLKIWESFRPGCSLN